MGCKQEMFTFDTLQAIWDKMNKSNLQNKLRSKEKKYILQTIGSNFQIGFTLAATKLWDPHKSAASLISAYEIYSKYHSDIVNNGTSIESSRVMIEKIEIDELMGKYKNKHSIERKRLEEILSIRNTYIAHRNKSLNENSIGNRDIEDIYKIVSDARIILNFYMKVFNIDDDLGVLAAYTRKLSMEFWNSFNIDSI